MPHLCRVNNDTAYLRESLGGVATISAGYPLRGAVDELASGEVAIVQMRNVDADSGVNWSEVQRIALPSKRPPAFLAVGDIIFTTRGTRNFALALDTVEGKAVCSPHFFVIRVLDANQIAPAFLAWQINQRAAQEYFQREATGSHILNIRREVIEKLPLAIPPLATQRAIIAFANAARAERAALAKLIENRNYQIEAIALGLHHSAKNPSEGLYA
jgi:Type I restriction modification DNA specificity domain